MLVEFVTSTPLFPWLIAVDLRAQDPVFWGVDGIDIPYFFFSIAADTL